MIEVTPLRFVTPVTLNLEATLTVSAVNVEPLISATEILAGTDIDVTCPTAFTTILLTGPYVPALAPLGFKATVGLPSVPLAFVMVTPVPAAKVLPKRSVPLTATSPTTAVKSVIAFNAEAVAESVTPLSLNVPLTLTA